MDINTLVKITSRAWSLSILASLDAGTPARQAPLLAASGAGRTAFAQSVAHLIEIGLLERNPGHGHPLRPEFRLTANGEKAAAMAGKIVAAGSGGEEAALMRRMWSVPVLSVIRKPLYFGDIRKALPPITDRALSQSLKRLETHRWVTRTIETELHPPRARYLAQDAGLEIARAVSGTF